MAPTSLKTTWVEYSLQSPNRRCPGRPVGIRLVGLRFPCYFGFVEIRESLNRRCPGRPVVIRLVGLRHFNGILDLWQFEKGRNVYYTLTFFLTFKTNRSKVSNC